MSEERLAKMNKKVVGLIDGEDFSDLVQMDVDTYAWFYKQAERALKNADDIHVMDLQLASEQKENKRYRERVAQLINYIEMTDDEADRQVHKIHVILDRLLEGDSE